MRKIYALLFIVALMNAALSFVIYQKPAASNACSSHCDVVLGSSYATFLGVPQSLIGILSFGFLALLAAYLSVRENEQVEKLVFFVLTLGGLYALRLLYLQAFVLGAFCPYCVVIDSSTILTGILFLWRKRPNVFAPQAIAF